MQGIPPNAMKDAEVHGTVSAPRCLQPLPVSHFLYRKIGNHRMHPISSISLQLRSSMKGLSTMSGTQKALSTCGNDSAFLLFWCVECLINQSVIKM